MILSVFVSPRHRRVFSISEESAPHFLIICLLGQIGETSFFVLRTPIVNARSRSLKMKYWMRLNGLVWGGTVIYGDRANELTFIKRQRTIWLSGGLPIGLRKPVHRLLSSKCQRERFIFPI